MRVNLFLKSYICTMSAVLKILWLVSLLIAVYLDSFLNDLFELFYFSLASDYYLYCVNVLAAALQQQAFLSA